MERASGSRKRRHRARSQRTLALLLAGLTAVAIGVAVSLHSAAVSQAAAPVPAAAASTSVGGKTLTISPATGVSQTGDSLKVSGTGFSTAHSLYVAVCAADGKAPASLVDCVGGPVPSGNSSSAYGLVSETGNAPTSGGGVPAKFAAGGSFGLTLTLPAATSGALDCATTSCAVYTASTVQGDRTQDLGVAVTFAAAATTSSTPTTSSTVSSTSTTTTSTTLSSVPVVTKTSGVLPTTVQPKTIRSASVVAGGSQEILFAGFTQGETAIVTVVPDSIKVNPVTADSDGIVKIDFTVPKDSTAGVYILEAFGRVSKITGVARFAVTAPVVVPPSTRSAAVSSTPTTAAITSAPTSTSPSTSSSTSTSTPATTTSTTSTAAAPPVGTSRRPSWLWYVLGAVVLLWLIFGIVALVRRRRGLERENAERERVLAEAAAAEQRRTAQLVADANSNAPTALVQPYGNAAAVSSYGEHELLSGRDDPNHHGLLSGQGMPTSQLPTTRIPNPESPTAPLASGSASTGQETGSWFPDFTGEFGNPRFSGAGTEEPLPPAAPSWQFDPHARQETADGAPNPADPGPGTAQWRPDFDDGPEPENPGSGPRHAR